MGAQALAGVRILDFCHSWAGPHATRILADYGAEVIRVEYVPRLCALRGARADDRMYDKHPMWFQVNRGKRSTTLNLHRETDRDIIRDLVARSTLVFDNARAGVMEKLGFGYEDLKKLKPDVILVTMAAYGKTGPWSGYAGYGGSIETVSGIQNLTAYEPGSKPARVKELDIVNGIAGACAAMTALVHHRRTGEGQWVDVSQMEAATHALLGEHLLEFVMNGTSGPPRGNRHRWLAPQGCYRCKGRDRWVTLLVRSDEEWRRLCDVLGHPEWQDDDRFATNEKRMEHHDLLDELIESWTSTRYHHDVTELLGARGLAAGAVLDTADLARDPHLEDRGYFASSTDGVPGLFPGLPFRMSRTPGAIRWRGPDLSRHQKEIICGLLGRPAEDARPVDETEIGTAFDPE